MEREERGRSKRARKRKRSLGNVCWRRRDPGKGLSNKVEPAPDLLLPPAAAISKVNIKSPQRRTKTLLLVCLLFRLEFLEFAFILLEEREARALAHTCLHSPLARCRHSDNACSSSRRRLFIQHLWAIKRLMGVPQRSRGKWTKTKLILLSGGQSRNQFLFRALRDSQGLFRPFASYCSFRPRSYS